MAHVYTLVYGEQMSLQVLNVTSGMNEVKIIGIRNIYKRLTLVYFMDSFTWQMFTVYEAYEYLKVEGFWGMMLCEW